MNSKRFLIAGVSLLFSCASFSFGGRPPREVKIYESNTTDKYCNPVEAWCQGRVGLVRKQEKEVLAYEDSDGMVAMTKAHFNIITAQCPAVSQLLY